MKVAFGGVNSVSHPPRQPGRSNEQTGTSNALAFPGSKSTQKGVTECSCCWSNFTSKGLVSINLLSFVSLIWMLVDAST
ncbi:hypothetical protein Bca4012_092284 [Brassica carinata]